MARHIFSISKPISRRDSFNDWCEWKGLITNSKNNFIFNDKSASSYPFIVHMKSFLYILILMQHVELSSFGCNTTMLQFLYIKTSLNWPFISAFSHHKTTKTFIKSLTASYKYNPTIASAEHIVVVNRDVLFTTRLQNMCHSFPFYYEN